jgi:hypothetical protein
MFCSLAEPRYIPGSGNEANQDAAPMEAGRLLNVLAQCLAAVARRFFTPPENLAPEGYPACMLEPGRAWV